MAGDFAGCNLDFINIFLLDIMVVETGNIKNAVGYFHNFDSVVDIGHSVNIYNGGFYTHPADSRYCNSYHKDIQKQKFVRLIISTINNEKS